MIGKCKDCAFWGMNTAYYSETPSHIPMALLPPVHPQQCMCLTTIAGKLPGDASIENVNGDISGFLKTGPAFGCANFERVEYDRMQEAESQFMKRMGMEERK